MFESYGNIQTCNFYLDKCTQLYKGDALLVYNLDDVIVKTKLDGKKEKEEGKKEDYEGNIDNFLSMICSQVREPLLGSLLSIDVCVFFVFVCVCIICI